MPTDADADPSILAGDFDATIRIAVTVETDKVKGSRFVGDLAPCVSADEALAFVQAVRDREPDASHHCWAWRLGDGSEQSSDDGEPRDTAGPPIMRRLESAELTGVVAVVTRWFGGTKLGRGGLIRAYGGAAAAAIEAAIVVHVPRLATVEVRHGYEWTGAIDGVIAAHDGQVAAQDFGSEVTRSVAVPERGMDAFRVALIEATAGQVLLFPPPPGANDADQESLDD